MSLAWPFFPLYIEALGGSATEIGLVYALGGLAGLILYPVGGYIADHRGRVKLVSIATYLFALSFIPFIIAQNWVMLAVGYFTQQLVLFYMPAVNAIMADSLPVHRRGIGFATITAIPQAVGLLSPFIGGYLIDHVFGGGIDGLTVAMRISYTAGIAIGLLVAVIRLKFLQETLKKSDSTVSLHNIPLLLKTSYIHLSKSLKWMSQTLRSIAISRTILGCLRRRGAFHHWTNTLRVGFSHAYCWSNTNRPFNSNNLVGDASSPNTNNNISFLSNISRSLVNACPLRSR